jgi:hypothetical protein
MDPLPKPLPTTLTEMLSATATEFWQRVGAAVTRCRRVVSIAVDENSLGETEFLSCCRGIIISGSEDGQEGPAILYSAA